MKSIGRVPCFFFTAHSKVLEKKWLTEKAMDISKSLEYSKPTYIPKDKTEH